MADDAAGPPNDDEALHFARFRHVMVESVEPEHLSFRRTAHEAGLRLAWGMWCAQEGLNVFEQKIDVVTFDKDAYPDPAQQDSTQQATTLTSTSNDGDGAVSGDLQTASANDQHPNNQETECEKSHDTQEKTADKPSEIIFDPMSKKFSTRHDPASGPKPPSFSPVFQEKTERHIRNLTQKYGKRYDGGHSKSTKTSDKDWTTTEKKIGKTVNDGCRGKNNSASSSSSGRDLVNKWGEKIAQVGPPPTPKVEPAAKKRPKHSHC